MDNGTLEPNDIRPRPDDAILKLYELYSVENHKYNTLIWQAPTAVAAVNVLAIGSFHLNWLMAMVLGCLNLVIILSMAKHAWHQEKFTEKLHQMADHFREDTNLGPYVPTFDKNRWYWSWAASWVLVRAMFIANLFYFVYVLFCLVTGFWYRSYWQLS